MNTNILKKGRSQKFTENFIKNFKSWKDIKGLMTLKLEHTKGHKYPR